jgi:uncharacterized protein YvpB
MMRFRHFLPAALLSVLLVAVGGVFTAPAATAQGSVTLWVTFGATQPGAGCSVDVTVDGGAGLSGASVFVVVSGDDSGAVISSDTGTANASGVTWLSIDTSSASAGFKGWASVSVNGAYVGGQSIWVTNGGCADGGKMVTMNGYAPSSSSSGASADESTASGAVIIPGAIAYQQQRHLSCEYSSLAIATGMLGDWVSEYDFSSIIPLNGNPHWGYRGDINGAWGNTTNYGVYAEPLVAALNTYGFQGDVFYGTPADLMGQIDMGRPTLAWIGARGEAGSFYDHTADGTRFKLTPYMHVVVVYGYDDAGVYVSDPGSGKLTHWSWASFKSMWSVMDGMALAVHW